MSILRRFVQVLALAVVLAAAGCGDPRPDAPLEWALAIHGGAGVIDREMDVDLKAAYLESLERALELGREVLEGGGSSLDAVERVIVFLEDDPKFNAGRGAVFTREGRNELDASIMDGSTLACGAVTGVTRIKHPIRLARRVMTDTPHVLLAGSGAEELAAELGLEQVDPDYFWTQRRWDELQRRLGADQSGTVGAVARDREGHLAAGTSTGGLTGKMFGRIGDSPIVGAGTYADDRTCAISATGKGEEFIRHNVAARISILMDGGMGLDDAARQVVHGRLRSGDGGVIGVDGRGGVTMVFNTAGMYRGTADSSGRFEVAIWE